MAYVSMFICCRSAELINDKKSLQIIDPTDEVQLEYIPSFFSFAAVFGLSDIDFSLPHTVNIVLSSENSEVELVRQSLDMPINVNITSGKIQFFSNLTNVNIQKEGFYYFNILLDGVSLGQNQIRFTKAGSV